MFLPDRSSIRRKEGISLAREAVKKHRRDGRFFGEILSEGMI
ncbi:MAG: hypothetical protein PUI91_05520 [Firmicutes bacterium]|nr:hypothetical protein [Bacillota bacterium]MDY2920676.1 hypothetical protein [Lentihominibacter sp.]